MIQCNDCEFFIRGPGGQVGFRCDPFSNVKEPECLVKWQLVKLDIMVQSYQATVAMYRRLAPLQEKMFRHMEREVDDLDEADRWKLGEDENEDDNKDDNKDENN